MLGLDNTGDYIAFAAAIAFANQLLGIVKQIVLEKVNGKEEEKVPYMTPLACQVDPVHFQRVKEMGQSIGRWDDMIQRGEFSCVWKSRDEVRDYIESQRLLHNSLKELTTAVGNLTVEVRRQNGGPK